MFSIQGDGPFGNGKAAEPSDVGRDGREKQNI